MPVASRPSDIEVIGDVALVSLANGMVATIDAEDVSKVKGRAWSAHKDKHRWYAYSGKLRMSRVILGVSDPTLVVDHINRHGTLDNRKSNIRAVTVKANSRNRGPDVYEGRTSRYKGVCLRKVKGQPRYATQLMADRKFYFGGLWRTAEAAALVYNAMAHKYHGEYAYQNPLPLSPEAILTIERGLAKDYSKMSLDAFEERARRFLPSLFPAQQEL